MKFPFVFRGIVLPEELRESIDRYVEHGIPTGGFLEAVIESDLGQSVARADETNLLIIPSIVGYLYLKCPAECWGFKGQFDRWIELKKNEKNNKRRQ